MRALIHFDLGGQVCFGERFFQDVLLVGPRHVVV
jgi:hypothetical protein